MADQEKEKKSEAYRQLESTLNICKFAKSLILDRQYPGVAAPNVAVVLNWFSSMEGDLTNRMKALEAELPELKRPYQPEPAAIPGPEAAGSPSVVA